MVVSSTELRTELRTHSILEIVKLFSFD